MNLLPEFYFFLPNYLCCVLFQVLFLLNSLHWFIYVCFFLFFFFGDIKRLGQEISIVSQIRSCSLYRKLFWCHIKFYKIGKSQTYS